MTCEWGARNCLSCWLRAVFSCTLAEVRAVIYTHQNHSQCFLCLQCVWCCDLEVSSAALSNLITVNFEIQSACIAVVHEIDVFGSESIDLKFDCLSI